MDDAEQYALVSLSGRLLIWSAFNMNVREFAALIGANVIGVYSTRGDASKAYREESRRQHIT